MQYSLPESACCQYTPDRDITTQKTPKNTAGGEPWMIFINILRPSNFNYLGKLSSEDQIVNDLLRCWMILQFI